MGVGVQDETQFQLSPNGNVFIPRDWLAAAATPIYLQPQPSHKPEAYLVGVLPSRGV